MATKHRKLIVDVLKDISQYTLLTLYHLTFGLYLRVAYNLRRTPDSDKLPRGPYVLLGNHCNNFDGLFLQCLLFRPIRYVITDTVFKKPLLGGLFSWVGFIPKRKFSADVSTVRQIIKAIAGRGVVGIFPEGMRSWDGRSVAISPGTFKLIQMLKVPVVTARIMGSYLSGPRWANTPRRGRVEVKLTTLLDGQAIRSMSLSDITARISEALYHDEASWEAQKQIPFRGKGLAEGFERLLYLCPSCGCIGTMITHRHRISCTACGAEYHLDVYGRIRAISGKLPADNAADLSAWQKERFHCYIAEAAGEILLRDDCARLSCREDDTNKMKEIAMGTLMLTRSALILQNLCFPLEEMSGVALNFKSGLMFRHGTAEYLVQFDNPRVSIHKWGSAIENITGNPVG